MKRPRPLLSTANRQHYLQPLPARSTLERPLWGNPGGFDPDLPFVYTLATGLRFRHSVAALRVTTLTKFDLLHLCSILLREPYD